MLSLFRLWHIAGEMRERTAFRLCAAFVLRYVLENGRMDTTNHHDLEALRREWKQRSEICRRVRQNERERCLSCFRQIALSISLTLVGVFGLSAWAVSRILPFDRPAPSEQKAVYDPVQWTPQTPAWMLEALDSPQEIDLSGYPSL